ncbi:hypothetical protein SKAU_G00254470 [Synaphobranchus kaupii]|uniref:Uncharacterized protein n=1 Tax=Synaphobranchus kaupii TaxID=118154 RepID=A0A9Q1IS81_SYNKA|nr:hypothetical protein SKAU_G00254470 [Synaphobranchus kaupii]
MPHFDDGPCLHSQFLVRNEHEAAGAAHAHERLHRERKLRGISAGRKTRQRQKRFEKDSSKTACQKNQPPVDQRVCRIYSLKE